MPSKKILFNIFFIIVNGYAQDASFDTSGKTAIIHAINFQLRDRYVFPDVADVMANDLLKRLRRGDYDEIHDKTIFADSLKHHLYTISKDKHIGVSYDKELARQLGTPHSETDPTEKFKIINERVKKFNYGFEELKILEGNVGYLKITAFAPTTYGGKTASSAMQFVSNCDALIFDLRVNYGGDPSMIQLLISYLYSDQPVHLNDFYHRKEQKTTQLWTLPFVSGQRLPNTPVFVLISSKTISAGEEFAYDLKHLKRATILGETSAGAANFGEEFIADGNFIVWVPTGRAINPITHTNWEGTGVEPDVKMKAADAMEAAYKMALEIIE